MSACGIQRDGTVELYFYDELPAEARRHVEAHLASCVECRRALEELRVIRAALGESPMVSAPPGGDWSAFMARLDRAVRGEPYVRPAAAGRHERAGRAGRYVFAAAAVIALVTLTILVTQRQPPAGGPPPAPAAAAAPAALDDGAAAADPALAQLSEQHFRRSKLVVLGLATRDPADLAADDWDYERRLAAGLLNDTRLYRQAAEERGMTSLAGVMRDLELVLLQTAMAESADAESLAQLQRLIRRRDLITKMDVSTSTGLLP